MRSVIRNLDLLYPIFPSIAILLRQILPDMSETARNEVFTVIRALINSRSHILLVQANLSFAIRILAHDRAEETDALLIEVYERPKTNMMIKRDVLLAMTRRGVDYWLSAQLKQFAVVTPWERRALIVASYILSDEGHTGDAGFEMNCKIRTLSSWNGSAKKIMVRVGNFHYE